MYYVLTDKDGDSGAETIIAVFDRPVITAAELKSFYGEYEEIDHVDVSDSGIEWMKYIKLEGRIDRLTLESFTLNKI